MRKAVTWHVPGKPWQAVASGLSWDSASPLEMLLEFPGADVTWVIGRDLMCDALQGGRAGSGDVQIEVSAAGVLYLTLTSPFGEVRLMADPAPLREFLQASYEVVARGEEVIPVDEAITRILGES